MNGQGRAAAANLVFRGSETVVSRTREVMSFFAKNIPKNTKQEQTNLPQTRDSEYSYHRKITY